MVRNDGGQSQGQLEKTPKNNPGCLHPVQGEAGTCGAPGIRGDPGEPGDDGPEGLLGRPGEQGKEVRALADTTAVTAAHRHPLPRDGDKMGMGKVCCPVHWLWTTDRLRCPWGRRGLMLWRPLAGRGAVWLCSAFCPRLLLG